MNERSKKKFVLLFRLSKLKHCGIFMAFNSQYKKEIDTKNCTDSNLFHFSINLQLLASNRLFPPFYFGSFWATTAFTHRATNQLSPKSTGTLPLSAALQTTTILSLSPASWSSWTPSHQPSGSRSCIRWSLSLPSYGTALSETDLGRAKTAPNIAQ